MLIPTQNSNKTNCKIQDYFANRQIKEDVKYNKIKFKLLLDLSLEGFDSACRSSNSTLRGARSILNFEATFLDLKMATRISRMIEKDTQNGLI
jgi:hypothetical protein